MHNSSGCIGDLTSNKIKNPEISYIHMSKCTVQLQSIVRTRLVNLAQCKAVEEIYSWEGGKGFVILYLYNKIEEKQQQQKNKHHSNPKQSKTECA